MNQEFQTIPAFLKAYSDSSFTNPHEVVLPEEPPDCMGNFTHMGAKYWGFETNRHRSTSINESNQSFSFDTQAHHWFTIGLKHKALVHEIRISTKWFTGNQVPEVSVVLIDRQDDTATEVLTRVKLAPDSEQTFSITPVLATDCHIKCFHEGGISRVILSGTDFTPLYDHHNNKREPGFSHNPHISKP